MHFRGGGNEGRFAGVGISHQSDVGHHFQFQKKRAALPNCPGSHAAGRLVRAALETRVAQTSHSAFGDHDLLAFLRKVGQEHFALVVEDHGAKRHSQDHVFAVPAVLLIAASVLSPACLVLRLVDVVAESRQVPVGPHDDVAAVPAVASVGSAFGIVLGPEEAAAASSAVAGRHLDLRFIDKHIIQP